MRRAALVTGGTRGIGLAISLMLAEKGYDIAVNGVREESEVAGSLQKISDTGVKVVYCRGDIGTAGGRKDVVTRLTDELGGINLLVNNAGVAPLERMDALSVTEESYDRVMEINLKGPFFLTRDVANMMIRNRKAGSNYEGMIINIGSISATVVSPNRAEYCISKAGFAMHSSIWAARLAEYGINVYEVRPGVISTDMTSGVTEKYDRLIGEGLNIQPRWGAPEDVALAVVSLAEGNFPFSSGGVFMVDGGLTVCRL